MGILNVTPDSFYAPSRTMTGLEIEKRVARLVEEGADIIDIGGYSTRPGATEVSEREELERLAAGMEVVRRLAPDTIVSVDTFRARVADRAVSELGCDIINDVCGTNRDPDMIDVVLKHKVPYILTHNRGTAADTATVPTGGAPEVLRELHESLTQLYTAGISDVIIDPGIGFSKDLEQSYDILRNLAMFEALHCPILIGVSRKRVITRLLGVSADESLVGTSVLNALCLERGASILRVHDVRSAGQCVAIYEKMNEKSHQQITTL